MGLGEWVVSGGRDELGQRMLDHAQDPISDACSSPGLRILLRCLCDMQ